MKALKRKNVKKTLACVLGVSLPLTAMAVPALAEEQNTVPQIQSSDVVLETDKLIDRQLDCIGVSVNIGFRRLMDDAVKVLALTST